MTPPSPRRQPPRSRRSAKVAGTTAFEVESHLLTPEDRAAYLDAWLTEHPDDPAGIARALGQIARAHGMTAVATDTGLRRETLYRGLGDHGNPTLTTMLKVLASVGLRLRVEPAPE